MSSPDSKPTPATVVPTRETSSRLRYIALLFGCGAIVIVGYRFGAGLAGADAARNHGLSIDSKDLTLGNLWARKRLARTLSIYNGGPRTAEIVKFKTSCACTSIEPETLVLAPGERRPLRLTIDLTSSPFGRRAAGVRDVALDLSAVVRGSPQPAHWRLSVTARDPVSFTPLAVQFDHDELNAGNDHYPTRTVSISAAPDVTAVRAICDRRMGNATLVPFAGPAARGPYSLSVTPNSDLPLGPFQFEIGVEVTLRSGERFEAQSVPVTGCVVDDIEFVPSELRFPPSPVGETLRQSVVVWSRTGRTFNIVSLPAAGGVTAALAEDSAGSAGEVAGADSYALCVASKVERIGPHTAEMPIVVRFGESKPRSVSLKIITYGVEAIKPHKEPVYAEKRPT